MDRVAIKKHIRRYEGCKYKSYTDTEGYRTVAIGFNLDDPGAEATIEALGLDFDLVHAGKVALSDGQCDALLDAALTVAINDAKSLVSNFDQHPEDVKTVLVDLSYNLGKFRFAKFKNTLAAFEACDYCAAARGMAQSTWATQVGQRATDDIAIVQAHCGV
jgi:lysozyme